VKVSCNTAKNCLFIPQKCKTVTPHCFYSLSVRIPTTSSVPVFQIQVMRQMFNSSAYVYKLAIFSRTLLRRYVQIMACAVRLSCVLCRLSVVCNVVAP